MRTVQDFSLKVCAELKLKLKIFGQEKNRTSSTRRKYSYGISSYYLTQNVESKIDIFHQN